MNLVLDYGNSFAKVGIFENYDLRSQYTFAHRDELKNFLQNFSADNFILSSVTHEASSILPWVDHIKTKFILTAALPLPVKSLYATPETLGVDRIAGVCGAYQKFPGTNCLVIDAGTCVTYDFLDDKGNYHGGAISPGLKMRLQAMNAFTAKLPLVDVISNPPLIGTTTETCLQSGAINGMSEEIKGIISLYQQKIVDLKAILCGGDASFFENQLKGPIFAIPELVLSGLNSILIYNVGH
ncbi:type III pantothenate kinase [Chryseolinea sp. H1M3-3]|uniref:type III pantothenate kinase n=1 Tax=Chryseolinea sp. H1M3-3 TaxID=3034144 RepID=UPI0023EADD8D|nr:type III pantothenate kinase [Chryseolinea sp. H1M3-3]